MYSNLHFQIIAIIVKICNKLGPFPYLWNSKRRQLYITKDSKRRCIRNGVTMMGGTIVFGLRAFDAKVQGDMSLCNIALAFSFCNALGSIIFITFASNFNQVAAFLNGFYEFALKFEKRWMKSQKGKKTLLNYYLDIFLVVVLVVSIFGSVVVLIHYCLFPNSIYPNALLPKYLQDSLIIYLLMGIFLAGWETVAWMSLPVTCTFVLTYGLFIIPIIPQEFKSNRSNYKTFPALRGSASNLVRVYRQFEILQKNALLIVGMAIVPLQTVITQLILTCNYTLIRHWKELDSVTTIILVLITLIFQIVWFLFLNLSGFFHKHSVETIKSWKYLKWSNKADAKYISKFRKSCRPLRFGTEGYFTVRRLTVLKFMRGIVRGTFRALLTLKNV